MSTTPGGPEYLGDARPDPSEPANDNKKRLVVVGAIVVGGAVVAGGAWAATSFFATGAQPAEALPDSTIAYMSVDLDPSGAQKIEAIKTLRKFPGFTDEVDIKSDDDLIERLFEEATKSGDCEGLDYADDVKPWLGSRAAVAAVDLGEDEPAAVGVIQVTDSSKAEDGMATVLEKCGGSSDDDSTSSDGSEGSSEPGGWVVDGDWLVVAETEEQAQQVVDAAGSGTLADDASFGQWTGEAGDDGFMTFYVAKAAAQYLDDAAGMGSMLGGGALSGLGDSGVAGFDQDCIDSATTSEELDECFSAPTTSDPGSEEIPPELQQMIDDFDGMAATVRFDDGSVEIEYAVSNYQEDLAGFVADDAGADMVGSLPDDTIAAFGFALEEGWGGAVIDYFKTTFPEDADSIDEQISQLESETGLSIPEDLETLFGEGVSVSLGSGIDPDAIANGGPGEVPVGIRVKGDAGDIQAVLDKISDLAGPEAAEFLQVTEGDGYAVLALSDDYRSALEDGGDLSGTDDYSKVVEGDAQAVFYVSFDADDDWLVRLAGESPEVAENLEPLSAFGISGWVDDDVVHGLVKLTTD